MKRQIVYRTSEMSENRYVIQDDSFQSFLVPPTSVAEFVMTGARSARRTDAADEDSAYQEHQSFSTFDGRSFEETLNASMSNYS